MSVIIACILSLSSIFLAQQFQWSITAQVVILIAIALWCDSQVIWGRIADLRHTRYVFEYTEAKRHYDAALPEWRQIAYREALIVTVAITLVGTFLGAIIGWLSHDLGLFTLVLSTAYGLPMLAAVPYLARFQIATQQFVAERFETPTQTHHQP